MVLISSRAKSLDNLDEVPDNGVTDLNESFPRVNANLERVKVGSKINGKKGKRHFFQKTKPTLCDLQEIIVTHKLSETDADWLLENAGYPKLGAYLAFAHSTNLDPDIIPTHDLKSLLTLSIHSFVLEIDPRKAIDQLPVTRPHSLTDKQFDKLKIFVVSKILPLVQRHRYPSIAEIMIRDVIAPYPALDERNKELLTLLINEVARLDSPVSEDLHAAETVIDKDMPRERIISRAGPNNPGLDEAVEKVIEELHTNTRALHPTKFETLLKQFKHNDYEPVDMSVLGEALYDGKDREAERAVQFKISKLNTKLSPFGLQIERNTTYTLKLAAKDRNSPKD
jgi:hypothetical protein